MTSDSLTPLSAVRSHGGTQHVFTHDSTSTGTPMTFAAFVPDHAPGERLPLIWYLSGLTCTHANVMDKGEYRAACAAHRIILIAPDTSPRGPDLAGEEVPDDPDGAWDFGPGAGFYVDATEAPFARHYRMKTYIETELPALIAADPSGMVPADMARQGIMGHSMGGHGALTIALRNPGRFASLSAFAPIAAPMDCPWGVKALGGYLGPDRARRADYDACALLASGARFDGDILVDIGTGDPFIDTQLLPDRLEGAASAAGQPLTLRRQPGYDHSYFFISTFMAEHIGWHARRLNR